nr:MAG TPA: hypothetical protein [Caudoviricetes sp.]
MEYVTENPQCWGFFRTHDLRVTANPVYFWRSQELALPLLFNHYPYEGRENSGVDTWSKKKIGKATLVHSFQKGRHSENRPARGGFCMP